MPGLPEVTTYAELGGSFSDYAPVEDATTDEAAAYRNLYGMNAAALTQTACRAWCAFVGHATTPTNPARDVHGAAWGNSLAVKPTVARTGSGVFTVTWPTTVTDPLGTVHTLALRRCWANVEGSTPFFHKEAVTAANVVTVQIYTSLLAASDAVGTTIVVYVL